MFTGIIETIGHVASAKSMGGDVRLVIAASDFLARDISSGDSIACNGVCLTVVQRDAERLLFDVSVESINHSLIGKWKKGAPINLEMALLPTTRLGGHLVSGHVDGLATLVSRTEDARSWRMDFEVPDELKRYIARKGSVTLDGVSLTVNSVENKTFSINVIPHTFEVTTLGSLVVGEQAHIEVDIIARYLERLLTGRTDDSSNLSQAFLAEHGFG